MAWRLARRVVRGLPPSAQLLIKRARASIDGSDWAPSIESLRRSEDGEIERVAARSRACPGRLRILCSVLQQAPPWLEVSYGLATALRLRGHDVRGLLCDGLVPLCEMNLGASDRPPCEVCVGWLSRYEHAAGFQWSRLSRWVSAAETAAAIAAVEGATAARRDSMRIENVDISRLARRELQRYRRGFVFDVASDPAYSKWLVSAILLVRAARRLLEHEKPDVLLTASGRTLPTACLAEVARRRGVRVVSWDTEPTFVDGLVFSHESPAGLVPLDAAWNDAASRELTVEERRTVHEFIARWAKGGGTAAGDSTLRQTTDPSAIRRQLGLRPGAPLVVAFGNSAWDMAAVDRDVGFTSMFDWLFALVEFAASHAEVDLVIRAHPSEARVPDDLKSRTPICAEIRRRVTPLPSNVKLVDGDSVLSSYVLADMATVASVYTSRIGLEIALSGKEPWLAGETTYRGKGFTRDIASKEELASLLEQGAVSALLPPARVALAERFAYLWFFRYVTRLPILRNPARPFALRSFMELGPQGDPAIDRLCDAILTGAPFLDLS